MINNGFSYFNYLHNLSRLRVESDQPGSGRAGRRPMTEVELWVLLFWVHHVTGLVQVSIGPWHETNPLVMHFRRERLLLVHLGDGLDFTCQHNTSIIRLTSNYQDYLDCGASHGSLPWIWTASCGDVLGQSAGLDPHNVSLSLQRFPSNPSLPKTPDDRTYYIIDTGIDVEKAGKNLCTTRNLKMPFRILKFVNGGDLHVKHRHSMHDLLKDESSQPGHHTTIKGRNVLEYRFNKSASNADLRLFSLYEPTTTTMSKTTSETPQTTTNPPSTASEFSVNHHRFASPNQTSRPMWTSAGVILCFRCYLLLLHCLVT